MYQSLTERHFEHCSNNAITLFRLLTWIKSIIQIFTLTMQRRVLIGKTANYCWLIIIFFANFSSAKIILHSYERRQSGHFPTIVLMLENQLSTIVCINDIERQFYCWKVKLIKSAYWACRVMDASLLRQQCSNDTAGYQQRPVAWLCSGWAGVGLVIERSLVRLPTGALLSQLGQLSLTSLRGS